MKVKATKEEKKIKRRDFSAAVKKARKLLDLTQAELGLRLNNRTLNTISRWELAQQIPEEPQVILLALKGLILEKFHQETAALIFTDSNDNAQNS